MAQLCSQNHCPPCHSLLGEKTGATGMCCQFTAHSLSGAPHTTHSPAALAGWEAAPRVLACLFSLLRATTGRGRNGKTGSFSETSSHLTEVADPYASWVVSTGDTEIKGWLQGLILPRKRAGAHDSFPLSVGPRVPALASLHGITAPKCSRTVWRKHDIGFIQPYGALVWKMLQSNEYWQETQNSFRNF